MIETACPLDCYDACSISALRGGNGLEIKANSALLYPKGRLCSAMTKYFPEVKRLDTPMVDGREVSMKEALEAVAKALDGKRSLLWRGSGNLGVMQEVTNLLISEVDGYLTSGSLCDEAGIAGILEGRGVNRQLPLSQIEKADTIVAWGRNIPVTNAHLMPIIEGKKLIVIDPRETSLAKRADLHIQIKPRCDFYLAILLSRFFTMEDSQNDEWLEEWGEDFEEFYDFTRTFRIKAILDYMGLSLDDMGDFMTYLLESKKVVFLVGAGVQKYSIGHYVLQAIDSLAATLGLFGREGAGVSYFGSSRAGFKNPFKVKLPTVPMATAKFDDFDSVIIQGGNPASSMPNSSRVVESLKKTKTLIYFGLYENETSRVADIVIPAKSFLEKDDVRLSYGHTYFQNMSRVYEGEIGISEYDFTKEILKSLGKDDLLKSEEEYLNLWKLQAKDIDGTLMLPDYEEIPYANGFGEDGDEHFQFIDDFDDDFEDIKLFRRFRKNSKKEDSSSYWLLSPKYSKSINTQFERAKYLYVPEGIGVESGDEVIVSSEWGRAKFVARIDRSLRGDTVLIYSSTPEVNILTPAKLSEEGESACFGELKVELERVSSREQNL